MPGLSQQLLLVCGLLGRSQAQADAVAFPSGGLGSAETPVSLSKDSACTINPADATTGLMCWALGGARLWLHRGLNPGCWTRGFFRSPGGWGRPSLARCCSLVICRAERLPAAASGAAAACCRAISRPYSALIGFLAQGVLPQRWPGSGALMCCCGCRALCKEELQGAEGN